MWTILEQLFNDSTLSPHGLCLLWRPDLVWLQVGSDAVIALAYFSIPFALAVFAAKRPDVKYGWVFWSFATFIMACGMTHVMSIWTLWVPDYGWEGLVKAVTAAASISTAIALWPLLPKVLAYPTPAQFSKMGYTLARTEQQLGLLINGVTDYAIFMLDTSGRVTNWNVGAQRILGWQREEIVSQHFSRFYTVEAQHNRLPDRVLQVAAEKGRYEDEALHVRKDGSLFWASVVVDAVRDETDELIGFAKITRDITAQRESQDRLRAAREQLFQSQKMEAVGQLTGGVAHDFNNLLTIILGNLETAQRVTQQWQENAKQRIERAVKSALTGAKRASTLTNRLLAFSRLQPLAPKPLNALMVLRSIGDLIRSSMGETVDVEIVHGAGLWLAEVDPVQLESAILNLAINARDAMPEGGKLTIEATNSLLDEDYCKANLEVHPGQYVLISVTDNGTGMAPDVLAKAFDPFFTTKEVGQGTGLGLSQVYGFVKQSGGHVKIYSELGEGTTVKVYLPRLATDLRIQEPNETERLAPGDPTETILVIEDDPDVREYIADVLRELSYRVLEAPNGERAVQIFDKHSEQIDLLLTDVILPGMNGRRVAEVLQAKLPSLKVLYMTGYSRNAIVHQGRLDPGVHMLQKPITRDALSKTIRAILDSRIDAQLMRN